MGYLRCRFAMRGKICIFVLGGFRCGTSSYMYMRTAVVILNLNTVDYLRSFVPGILASLGEDDRLFVADSGSTDESLAFLESEYPQVGRIPLGKNFGFAEGYDRALAQIPDAEYYLLLNSDVEVGGDWLLALTDFMESHPDAAVCGPKLHALDRSGDKWVRTDRFEYAGAAGGFIDHYGYPFCRGRVLGRVEQDYGQYDEPCKVFWITGACLMIRSRVWRELGGLDASYFAHMEEIDLCWRAQLLGYEVWCVPQSVVWHIGGGTLAPASAFKLKLNYRNSIWTLEKNLPASIGSNRARRRIFLRKCIDGLSALAYLLTLRPAYFKAVVEAHREASATPQRPSPSTAEVQIPKVRIIAASFLHGKGVFSYISKSIKV